MMSSPESMTTAMKSRGAATGKSAPGEIVIVAPMTAAEDIDIRPPGVRINAARTRVTDAPGQKNTKQNSRPCFPMAPQNIRTIHPNSLSFHERTSLMPPRCAIGALPNCVSSILMMGGESCLR